MTVNGDRPQVVFPSLDGLEVEGGCDRCDAYQRVSVINGITAIDVFHDDDCPVLKGDGDDDAA